MQSCSLDKHPEDRPPRTTTPRRLAIDSARIDPKRDLTDWLSARRLSRCPLAASIHDYLLGSYRIATAPEHPSNVTLMEYRRGRVGLTDFPAAAVFALRMAL